MSKLQSPKLNTPIVAGRVYHDSTMRRLDTTLENVTGGLWDIPVNNHMLFSSLDVCVTRSTQKRPPLNKAVSRFFGTMTPPHHWAVSWWSVRFRLWSFESRLSAPVPGTTKSRSLSAEGNCDGWRDWRSHSELPQNLNYWFGKRTKHQTQTCKDVLWEKCKQRCGMGKIANTEKNINMWYG